LEIVINFSNGSVSLGSLGDVVLGEGFHHLEFLVPVSDSLGIEAIERIHDL